MVPSKMKKSKRPISLDDEVWARLIDIGAPYGMSPNALIAAAACELSRIKSPQLWHTLGRIAEGNDEALAPVPSAGSRRPKPAPVPQAPELALVPELKSKRAPVAVS
jgi:hypothetical protein